MMGEVSSEIPSGKVVTPAACHPSISTPKCCGLLTSSHVRKAGGKKRRFGIKMRETTREKSRWEFSKSCTTVDTTKERITEKSATKPN